MKYRQQSAENKGGEMGKNQQIMAEYIIGQMQMVGGRRGASITTQQSQWVDDNANAIFCCAVCAH